MYSFSSIVPHSIRSTCSARTFLFPASVNDFRLYSIHRRNISTRTFKFKLHMRAKSFRSNKGRPILFNASSKTCTKLHVSGHLYIRIHVQLSRESACSVTCVYRLMLYSRIVTTKTRIAVGKGLYYQRVILSTYYYIINGLCYISTGYIICVFVQKGLFQLLFRHKDICMLFVLIRNIKLVL